MILLNWSTVLIRLLVSTLYSKLCSIWLGITPDSTRSNLQILFSNDSAYIRRGNAKSGKFFRIKPDAHSKIISPGNNITYTFHTLQSILHVNVYIVAYKPGIMGSVG